MNLVNKSRLVPLDTHALRTKAVEKLHVTFHDNLTSHIRGLAICADNSDAIGLKVQTVALMGIFKVNPEELIEGNQINAESMIEKIDMTQQRQIAVNALERDFEGQLDRDVSRLLDGLNADDVVKVKAASVLLPEKYGVEVSQILSPIEQNRYSSMLALNNII